MLGLHSRKEVQKKVVPYVVAWMLCGFLIVLVPSSTEVLAVNVSLLISVVPSGNFYYGQSGGYASVLLLMIYGALSMPILVFFIARTIVSVGSEFSKQDNWLAALFLFMCPIGVFMADSLWADTSVKWGRMFLSLIQSGPFGVLVYFYFWFGCFAYGLTVLTVYAADKRCNLSQR